MRRSLHDALVLHYSTSLRQCINVIWRYLYIIYPRSIFVILRKPVLEVQRSSYVFLTTSLELSKERDGVCKMPLPRHQIKSKATSGNTYGGINVIILLRCRRLVSRCGKLVACTPIWSPRPWSRSRVTRARSCSRISWATFQHNYPVIRVSTNEHDPSESTHHQRIVEVRIILLAKAIGKADHLYDGV